MEYQEQIRNYLCDHKQEIVNILKALIEIPSVKGEAKERAPFGTECASVLKFTQDLYEKNGFATELDEDGGYLLSYLGESEKSLGIFAHADVVPTGDDWICTEPFSPIEKDGVILGRGALDDKSAIVISLYCAKMIRELQLPFASRLVCFTGANEESGMQDLKNYLKKHRAPDFSLVSDTAFPLYRGNKGRILCKAVKNSSFGDCICFYGGKPGTNVGKATATLPYDPALYPWFKARQSADLTVKNENGTIELFAQGIAKHTALPEGSINAAALIAKVLSDCDLLSPDTRKAAKFISEICADYYGACLGIDHDDAEFGKLTFVNYQIEADEKTSELYFNIRHGIGISQEVILTRLTKAFENMGFSFAVLDATTPHIVAKDHPMLRALMDVYQNYAGDANAQMYVNAGGTYGQLLPCAAEIGTSFGDWEHTLKLPEGHGNVHQPDEYIRIEGLLNAMELTMLMLMECDKRQKE